jgi:aminomethyltransferase
MSSNKTSLFEEHLSLNAKIVDFAGWQMPIQYKNLKQEVLAVRSNIGVFDVSHMGEFFIEGPDAIEFIDYLLPNDIKNAANLKAIYSPLCREDATIIDDLIVYKLSENRVMICVNAANIEKDFSWMQSQLKSFNCTLTNKSPEFSLLAIQGPNSFAVLSSLDLDIKVQDIEYYSIQVETINDQEIFLARTGYTGEDGFEVFGPHDFIKTLWSKLMNVGVPPCGLGARDVLRLEVAYPLYGHELDDTLTPLDAGLKWTIKMDKPNFIGKSTLDNYNPKYQTIKLIMDKGIARDGYLVENSSGKVIGKVTSGTMSVVLGKGIALARVEKALYRKDDEIFIDIRGKKYKTLLSKKAFVTGGHK